MKVINFAHLSPVLHYFPPFAISTPSYSPHRHHHSPLDACSHGQDFCSLSEMCGNFAVPHDCPVTHGTMLHQVRHHAPVCCHADDSLHAVLLRMLHSCTVTEPINACDVVLASSRGSRVAPFRVVYWMLHAKFRKFRSYFRTTVTYCPHCN